MDDKTAVAFKMLAGDVYAVSITSGDLREIEQLIIQAFERAQAPAAVAVPEVHAESECPAVWGYDPTGSRRTLTMKFPDGEFVEYDRRSESVELAAAPQPQGASVDERAERGLFESEFGRLMELSPDELQWDEDRHCYTSRAVHWAWQGYLLGRAALSAPGPKENAAKMPCGATVSNVYEAYEAGKLAARQQGAAGDVVVTDEQVRKFWESYDEARGLHDSIDATKAALQAIHTHPAPAADCAWLVEAVRNINRIIGDAGFNIGGPIEHAGALDSPDWSRELLSMADDYFRKIARIATDALAGLQGAKGDAA